MECFSFENARSLSCRHRGGLHDFGPGGDKFPPLCGTTSTGRDAKAGPVIGLCQPATAISILTALEPLQQLPADTPAAQLGDNPPPMRHILSLTDLGDDAAQPTPTSCFRGPGYIVPGCCITTVVTRPNSQPTPPCQHAFLDVLLVFAPLPTPNRPSFSRHPSITMNVRANRRTMPPSSPLAC